MDTGAREALNDVINKVLRKVSTQMDTKIEELDDTLIAWNLMYYYEPIYIFTLIFVCKIIRLILITIIIFHVFVLLISIINSLYFFMYMDIKINQIKM